LHFILCKDLWMKQLAICKITGLYCTVQGGQTNVTPIWRSSKSFFHLRFYPKPSNSVYCFLGPQWIHQISFYKIIISRSGESCHIFLAKTFVIIDWQLWLLDFFNIILYTCSVHEWLHPCRHKNIHDVGKNSHDMWFSFNKSSLSNIKFDRS
jgi:hypothetical protein